MVQILWKTVWQFLLILNMQLPYDPAITHLATYPREIKTYVHMKPCEQMCMASLFVTDKIGNSPDVIQWVNA